MKHFNTPSGKEICIVSSNKSAREFTIRTTAATYKTHRMSTNEFNAAKYWTASDWANFLKTDEYYKVSDKTI